MSALCTVPGTRGVGIAVPTARGGLERCRTARRSHGWPLYRTALGQVRAEAAGGEDQEAARARVDWVEAAGHETRDAGGVLAGSCRVACCTHAETNNHTQVQSPGRGTWALSSGCPEAIAEVTGYVWVLTGALGPRPRSLRLEGFSAF